MLNGFLPRGFFSCVGANMQKKKGYSRQKVEHIVAHNDKVIRQLRKQWDNYRRLPKDLITEGIMNHCRYLKNAISALTHSSAQAEQSIDRSEHGHI